MIALQKAMEDVETGKRSYQGFDYTDITYPRKQIHQFFVRLQTGKDGRSLIYFQSEFSKNPLPEEIETMLLRKNGSLPDYLQK